MTNLLYGAACPSLLPSSTMGEIDLLVSQIPDSVFFRVLDLASRTIIHVIVQAFCRGVYVF